ncbi:homoserine kinase [Sorangium atrum]|uniref:Homoserine kinase n=1 Tax=Sorangium atrum TaxID=2995308 RepID=A0ABT5C5M5_9BACT|nr:homoserine kinase [Sorangium aterium]MDC0680467.1 homoserine kinase [Sorangium aterium]
MAILTPLSLADARRIGALYGLEIADVRGLLAGSVNSNFALTLADGRGQVFLRVYEEQQLGAASREARMLEHLAAGGVATPQPLRRRDAAPSDAASVSEGAASEGAAPSDAASVSEGAASEGAAFVAEHAGKPVALFPWVAGASLCQARVTPDATRRVGAALARVHLVGASFEGANASRFDLDSLDQRLRGLRSPAPGAGARSTASGPAPALPPDVAAAVDELTGRLERIRAAAPRTPGPQTLIHGDLFRDNVLWEAGEISALLDFESASRGSAAFDLAVTMLAWCFGDDLDPDLVSALGAGYTAVRPLSTEERDRLFHESVIAALRFSITRITDFELRPKGSGVYKDFRRFLARQRTLERLGPEGLLALLGV